MFLKYFLLFVNALSFWVITAQTASEEQLALDYFANEIFTKEYDCGTKIFFSGESEGATKLNGGFSNCTDLGKEFENFCYEYKEEDKGVVRLSVEESIKLLRRPKKQKFKMMVYRHVEFEDKSFVLISLYKRNLFIDHYLIEILDGKAVAHCYLNEII